MPSNRYPFPISWQSSAHQSPTGRRLVADFRENGRRQVADWSATEIDRTVVVFVAAVFFSRKAVADGLQYVCDRGFISCINPLQTWSPNWAVPIRTLQKIYAWFFSLGHLHRTTFVTSYWFWSKLIYTKHEPSYVWMGNIFESYFCKSSIILMNWMIFKIRNLAMCARNNLLNIFILWIRWSKKSTSTMRSSLWLPDMSMTLILELFPCIVQIYARFFTIVSTTSTIL